MCIDDTIFLRKSACTTRMVYSKQLAVFTNRQKDSNQKTQQTNW